MNSETPQCGKRTCLLECRVTKNGHKFVMITEKSLGRFSKVMVFHDHIDVFRQALERVSRAELGAGPVCGMGRPTVRRAVSRWTFNCRATAAWDRRSLR